MANTCEHGDHPAPDGARFCSEACARCELTEHDATQADCAGVCAVDGLECDECGGVAIRPEPDGSYAQGQRPCAECGEIGFVCESHDGTPFWWSQPDTSGRA